MRHMEAFFVFNGLFGNDSIKNIEILESHIASAWLGSDKFV